MEGQTLMWELIGRGVGVAIVPHTATYGDRERLKYLPIVDLLDPIDMAAFWRKGNDSALRRLFVDTAAAVAKEIYGEKREPRRWRSARRNCAISHRSWTAEKS